MVFYLLFFLSQSGLGLKLSVFLPATTQVLELWVYTTRPSPHFAFTYFFFFYVKLEDKFQLYTFFFKFVGLVTMKAVVR
jgi:hypothetical protein